MKFIKSNLSIMRKLLFTLCAFFLVSIGIAQISTPCEDVKFIELKKKGIANLSESEMSYYSQKEKECDQYTNSLKTADNKLAEVNSAIQQKNLNESRQKAKKTRGKISTWFWIGVIAALFYFGSQPSTFK